MTIPTMVLPFMILVHVKIDFQSRETDGRSSVLKTPARSCARYPMLGTVRELQLQVSLRHDFNAHGHQWGVRQ